MTMKFIKGENCRLRTPPCRPSMFSWDRHTHTHSCIPFNRRIDNPEAQGHREYADRASTEILWSNSAPFKEKEGLYIVVPKHVHAANRGDEIIRVKWPRTALWSGTFLPYQLLMTTSRSPFPALFFSFIFCIYLSISLYISVSLSLSRLCWLPRQERNGRSCTRGSSPTCSTLLHAAQHGSHLTWSSSFGFGMFHT